MPLPPITRHPLFWFLAWLGWFGFLLFCSSRPATQLTFHPFNHFDKLEHSGYFTAGSTLVGLGLFTAGWWPRRWWVVVLVAACVGAWDEWFQQFSLGRSALDQGDWIADTTGGFLGCGVTLWLAGKFGKRG